MEYKTTYREASSLLSHVKVAVPPAPQSYAYCIRTKADSPDTSRELEIQLRESGLVACVTESDEKTVTLSVDAPHMWLAEAAEAARLKKALKTGVKKEFVVSHSELFAGFDKRTHFFSSREKVHLISQALEAIPPGPGLGAQPDIDPSKPLLSQLRSSGFVVADFPFHDEAALNGLASKWLTLYLHTEQPIDEVYAYFGAEIAFYFAWLETYTRWLALPALFGGLVFVATHVLPSVAAWGVLAFAAFITLWATLFMESWKRTSSVLAYNWNVDEFEASETPRFEYTGDLVWNPILQRHERHFPWSQRAKRYALTIPATIASIAFAIAVMLGSFAAEDALRGSHWAVQLIPLALYGLFVPLFNMAYRKLALVLNNHENHRTETQYKDALVIKLAAFQFVNCYASLFYAAFVVRDIDRLTTQLTSLLFTSQILFGTIEVATPLALKLYAAYAGSSAHKEGDKQRVISKASSEAGMSPYPSVYDDYLEMTIQFGYISLFAAALPLAPLLAFANNIIEVRADAYKLVRGCRRPLPWQAGDIGVWWTILQIISVASVITNVALVGLTTNGLSILMPSTSHAVQIAILIAAEHALLMAKYLLAVTVPNRPEWLELRIQEEEAVKASIISELSANKPVASTILGKLE